MTTKEFLVAVRNRNARVGKANRLKGEKFEFAVLAEYKRNSDFAVRSAGSHSLFDVIARRAGKLYYINCKTNGYREQSELEALKQLKKKLTDNEVIILANKTTGRVEYITL